MKKLLVLLTIACATVAFAENQTIFSLDFEVGEGYSAGSVTGQNNWEDLAWWVGTHSFVIANAEGAQSGSQYLHVAEDGESGANQLNNRIDISRSYTAGMKLLVHAWGKADFQGTEPMSVRFHCLGTSGKTYDVEIAEFNFKQDGSGNAFVTGKDLKFEGLVEGEYYEFGVQIDPSTKAVEKVFVGENVYEGEGMTYKSATAEGCGSLPDGIRVYNGKGCLDNFKIDVVPEPAFLGLLALLGLFFVRKER
ncbi:hypothetical protein IKZ70_02060 [bacterium]|nr:hypothetical protein [bacterium]